MAAAIKAARRHNLGAGHRIVVVLPDGIRNYMTKFVTNQWMEAHLFMNPPEHSMRLAYVTLYYEILFLNFLLQGSIYTKTPRIP